MSFSGADGRGRRRQSGFSLIELAVVLVIIGLLVGGGIVAISATGEQTRRSDQQRQLLQIREALYGFALAEGRLPCPDTDGADGQEDRSGSGGCDGDEGRLPWVDLGLGRQDAWGNPILYHVDEDFAGSAAANGAAFSLTDDGNLTVTDRDGVNIVQDAPAVLVSFGPQGRQVWAAGGYPCSGAVDGFSEHEIENCDGNNTFVDAGYRTADSPDDGRFDDMLIWIPPAVLKARMVRVGKLP